MVKKETLLKLNICIDNEYLDLYVELINSNVNKPKINGETQRHHIIPKYYYKLNGLTIDNNDYNIVNLSYKDHILAHYYLLMCSSNDRYINANDCAIRYVVKRDGDLKNLSFFESDEFIERYKRGRENAYKLSHTKECNKRIQEKLKGRISPNKGNIKNNKVKKSRKQENPKNKKLSDIASQRVGEKNSFYGKKHSEKSKELMSIKKGFKCAMLDYNTKEVLKVFNSINAAGRYLNEIGATSCSSAANRVLYVCRSKNLNHIAYGYSWKFLDKE